MCQLSTIEYLICPFSLSIFDILNLKIVANKPLYSLIHLAEEGCCSFV